MEFLFLKLFPGTGRGSFLLPACVLFFLSAGPGCSSLLFYPDEEMDRSPLLDQVDVQDIFFESSDGVVLNGWYLTPLGETPSRGAILHLHGNAENISTHSLAILWLVKEGYSVLAFDYRGYGRSTGHPSLAGVHEDSRAALAKAIELSADSRVFVFGQSIGGSIAVYTVATYPDKEKIRALIVDSAYSGLREIARQKSADFFLTWPLQYPLSWMFSDRYSAEKWVPGITPVPVLILHGRTDTIVPVEHGRRIFTMAVEPRELWETEPPGHIRSFADQRVRQRFLEYLEAH